MPLFCQQAQQDLQSKLQNHGAFIRRLLGARQPAAASPKSPAAAAAAAKPRRQAVQRSPSSGGIKKAPGSRQRQGSRMRQALAAGGEGLAGGLLPLDRQLCASPVAGSGSLSPCDSTGLQLIAPQALAPASPAAGSVLPAGTPAPGWAPEGAAAPLAEVEAPPGFRIEPAVVLARLAHGMPVHESELAALFGPGSPLSAAEVGARRRVQSVQRNMQAAP